MDKVLQPERFKTDQNSSNRITSLEQTFENFLSVSYRRTGQI